MLKVLFIGTAELAVSSLRALGACPDYTLVGVVTQPDRPQGRKLQLKPSPVKEAAMGMGLPVLQPLKIRSEESLSILSDLAPDLIVVAAYGQILPQSLLDLPRWGCLNVHTSLLPKYRGAAPIQWAILNGDSETGVTLMQMDAGLDTGPMLAQQTTPISGEDTAETIHDRLATIGGELLLKSIPDWIAGRLPARPQPAEGMSYARKIEKQDGLLEWKLPARVLWNRIRGLVPWPGAFFDRTENGATAILKVWQAEPLAADKGEPGEVLTVDSGGIVVRCGEDALRLRVLQREGGKRLPAREFLAGYPIAIGEKW